MANQKKLVDEKRLAVRLDGELHDQAKAQAKREGATLSDIIRTLLFGWLQEKPKEEQK